MCNAIYSELEGTVYALIQHGRRRIKQASMKASKPCLSQWVYVQRLRETRRRRHRSSSRCKEEFKGQSVLGAFAKVPFKGGKPFSKIKDSPSLAHRYIYLSAKSPWGWGTGGCMHASALLRKLLLLLLMLLMQVQKEYRIYIRRYMAGKLT